MYSSHSRAISIPGEVEPEAGNEHTQSISLDECDEMNCKCNKHITTNEMFTMPNIYCNPENHSSVLSIVVRWWAEGGTLVTRQRE